eukprot:CAMPEP_0119369908 /NCGR_PEP_ID=MMETSP1334-20130426/16364_1 /TAXON_ID=127549 /ORGANISM="Calcidiscus leptoporus, Strain RCC1130" /LENGTH=120 /DNA_ID=CAMNT_0007386853 /DNA_START=260 /DNA_END=622 /DNA_ORIENTATION=-
MKGTSHGRRYSIEPCDDPVDVIHSTGAQPDGRRVDGANRADGVRLCCHEFHGTQAEMSGLVWLLIACCMGKGDTNKGVCLHQLFHGLDARFVTHIRKLPRVWLELDHKSVEQRPHSAQRF